MMCGLPGVSVCPKCKKGFDNNYDAYDVEAGFPNTGKGRWRLQNWCAHCEHEFEEEFQVAIIEPAA